MPSVGAAPRIWLCTQPTDMRRTFDGLSALLKNHLFENPPSGHWLACINRKQTQITVLGFEDGGYYPVPRRSAGGQQSV